MVYESVSIEARRKNVIYFVVANAVTRRARVVLVAKQRRSGLLSDLKQTQNHSKRPS